MNDPQLTYGSADGVAGRTEGGWGVLLRSGIDSTVVESRLADGVSVDLPATVPAFPSNQQLDERPVRFRRTPGAAKGSSFLWRSVEAGADHTGRPGNVFTHAAYVQATPRLRPIDWLGSPSWLSPYGAEAVRTAYPPERLTPPSSPITRLLDWLHKSGDQPMTRLPGLVDALLTQTPNHHLIVLRVDSREAAQWMALVSWLLTDEAACAIGMSTYEDGKSLRQCLERGVNWAAISPQQSLGQLPPGAIALDASAPAEARDDVTAGPVWQFADGLEVPRSRWSLMALDLLWLSQPLIESILTARDSLAPEIQSLAPELSLEVCAQWALRIAMLAAPGAVVVGRDDAIGEILRDLPSALWNLADIIELAVEVEAQRPTVPDLIDARVQQVSEVARDFRAANLGLQSTRLQDEASSIELAKHPAALFFTRADEALREEHLVPSPVSALCGAAALEDRPGSLDQLLFDRTWVRELPNLTERQRLATLHVVCQSGSEPTHAELLTAFALLLAGEEFERLAPMVLQLVARADLAQESEDVSARTSTHWYRELVHFVGRQSSRDLYSLSWYFSPATALATRAPTNQWAASTKIAAWAQSPPRNSVWSLPTLDGVCLAAAVHRIMTSTTLEPDRRTVR